LSKQQSAGKRWHLGIAIGLSAVLLALYARYEAVWFLGFVALVPWLLLLNSTQSLRSVALSGVLMSAAFVAAIFVWFGAAIGNFTGVGPVGATAALLLLAPLMQGQIIAFALVRQLAGRRYGAVLRALSGAAAWVAYESFVPKLLGDTLGHGLFPSETLRQSADLGGAAWLTLLVLLVNEAVATAIERRHLGPRAWGKALALGAVLLGGTAGYGVLRLNALQTPPTDNAATLRIAMVQASITDYERLRRDMGAYAVVRHVLDTHYALSMSAIRDHDADVLLWSETVYPTSFGSPRSEDGAALDREIQAFVDSVGVPLVFGTYDRDDQGEYNAAAFLEPGKGLLGTYRKTHPFPLTEHLPAWADAPWVRRLLPWAGTWQPGDGARVLPLRTADGREVNVLPLICLDDVYTDLAIDGARLGAQAIIGMSNDSWFTDYPIGARLHLAVAAFRSIETRLPQVRVTTNGLSAIIDDTGKVQAATEMGQQAVLTAFVSARDPAPTLMVRWGDWIGRAGALFLLGLCALTAWRGMSASRLTQSKDPSVFEATVLPRPWRAIAAALRLCAGLGLAHLAFDMSQRIGWQVASLSQLWWFAASVVAPLCIAWAIEHAFKATVSVDGSNLVIDQRRQRIEIAVASITALRAWRLPLPHAGVQLVLASGKPWSQGLVLNRPQALQRALTAAGAPLAEETGLTASLNLLSENNAAAQKPRLDNAILKFGLFPLLPALAAFHLHQFIAFGGPFGEWLTYGPAAWFGGLAIWWGAWSLGMMLFAAGLRVLIEIMHTAAIAFTPTKSAQIRDALAWFARLAFYVGVPAWLALRLFSAN